MANRIKSMDALRAVAILLVVLAHSVLGFGAPSSLAPLQLGGIGVDLFFVLSGWLLGGQLFKEMETGRIEIKRFWVRRWMRTLPAYYAVLVATIVQQLIANENFKIPYEYFFFLQNYFYPMEIFYISWSLSVEEQFYLMIAPALALTLKLNSKQRLFILLSALMIPAILRSLDFYVSDVQTHVRLDGCLVGVILACIKYQHKKIWSFLVKYSMFIAAFCTILFFLYFYQRWHPQSWIGEPGYFARSVMFGGWVIYANSNDVVKRTLSFPFAYYIATRSYAIYLLHPEAIAVVSRVSSIEIFLVYFVAVMALTLLLSEILYRTIELPFMSLREKIPLARSRKAKVAPDEDESSRSPNKFLDISGLK